MSIDLCGVLLAAGSSSRFGSKKLLHPLPDGDFIGVASAKHLKRVVRNCVAVVSNDTGVLAEHLTKQGYTLIVNKNNSGIGSSIACGIKQTEADAWIIMLADMPFIRYETIHQIAHLLHLGNRIVSPYCKNRRGHPVGFSRYYREELISLNSDQGAKSIIEKYQQDLVSFNTTDNGCLQDIDTLEDLHY